MFADALTSVSLHNILAHAPLPWSRGGANKPVLEPLQCLARLERETRSLLEGKLALRLNIAFYGIFRLPIHFAVKMASGSGVGVVCEEAALEWEGGGFSAPNILHLTGFLTPTCGPMAWVPEFPRKALAQGQWSRGGLLGWGPEAVSASWCAPERLRS